MVHELSTDNVLTTPPYIMVRTRIIVHNHLWKFWDCTSVNSTENIHEGYRNGLSKTVLEFKNCKQQLFTLTMCFPACLWTQIAKTPFHYAITAQTLLAIRDDYLQFPALAKKYRIASMVIITWAVNRPRDVERRESGSVIKLTGFYSLFLTK